MPEESIKQQLNYAKRTAGDILLKAGYKIEKASNQTFCLTAMRDAEWRIIAIGTRPLIRCEWFKKQAGKLERLPTPDPKIIRKEIWIKEAGEHKFSIFCWKNNQWISEDLAIMDFKN